MTDKFDFTFLCGDLNFRLNISRLHADTLILRKGVCLKPPQDVVSIINEITDYAQALKFDQLNDLLKEGTILNGFNEEPIKFSPTYKYDVPRTSKRSKRQTAKVNQLDPAERRSVRFKEKLLNVASRAAKLLNPSFTTPPSKSPNKQENVWPQIFSPPSPSLRIFQSGLSFFNVVLVNPSGSSDALQTEDKGVYDSSHKRRVPSW